MQNQTLLNIRAMQAQYWPHTSVLMNKMIAARKPIEIHKNKKQSEIFVLKEGA